MNNINKERESFENILKRRYYGSIVQQQMSRYHKIIDETQKTISVLGIATSLPYQWVTVNNKSLELAKIFESKGISMYSSIGTIDDKESVETNILGESILIDVASKANVYAKHLAILKKLATARLLEKNEKFGYLKNNKEKNKMVQCINKKRLAISLDKYHNFDKESIDEIAPLAENCVKIDKEIFEYRLDAEHIIPAISKMFITRNYSNETIDHFSNKIYSDLTTLGLEEVINPLRDIIDEIRPYKELSTSDCGER